MLKSIIQKNSTRDHFENKETEGKRERERNLEAGLYNRRLPRRRSHQGFGSEAEMVLSFNPFSLFYVIVVVILIIIKLFFFFKICQSVEDDAAIRRLEEAVVSQPGDPSLHFDLGVLLWDKGGELPDIKEKAAQHFLIAAKLNPQNPAAFTYLGHYYARVAVDSQRAIKCYQRALSLNPDDSIAGEAVCDILDATGKETLEIAVCREASLKSPRAFWALCRLGYLLVIAHPNFLLLHCLLFPSCQIHCKLTGQPKQVVRSRAESSAGHQRLSHMC